MLNCWLGGKANIANDLRRVHVNMAVNIRSLISQGNADIECAECSLLLSWPTNGSLLSSSSYFIRSGMLTFWLQDRLSHIEIDLNRQPIIWPKSIGWCNKSSEVAEMGDRLATIDMYHLSIYCWALGRIFAQTPTTENRACAAVHKSNCAKFCALPNEKRAHTHNS